MKKAFSFFAALFLLLAAGCEKQSKEPTVIPEPPTSFTADLSVDFGGNAMKARIAQKNPEYCEISILSPEIMKPLVLTYIGGECTASYDGLEFKSEPDRFPQAEFGALLTQALICVAQDMDIQKTFSNGIRTYKGLGSRGSFCLTQNADSGLWQSFYVEGAGLKIEFTDVTVT